MNENVLNNAEEKNVNEYKGYSLFKEVSNPSLQAWNRCNIVRNISEAHGKAVAEGYADALNELDRTKMLFMFKYIEVHGYDKVNAEVSRGVNA